MYQSGSEESLIEDTQKFVLGLFKKKLPNWALYHNLQHTVETVNTCLEIGKALDLNEEDLEIICISAWFHDTGYMFDINNHEEKSSDIAVKFLKGNNYPEERIKKVIDCIMATKISRAPGNLMESIICDSDLVSLGKDDYFKQNDLLKLEIEKRENIKISEISWLKRSYEFLSTHTYYTDYAKLNFNGQLSKNLLTLQRKIEEY